MYDLDLHIPHFDKHEGWCTACGMPCLYCEEFFPAETERSEAWGQVAITFHPASTVVTSQCCEATVSDDFTDAIAEVHADAGRACVACGGIAGYDFPGPMVYADYAECLPDGRCLACEHKTEAES